MVAKLFQVMINPTPFGRNEVVVVEARDKGRAVIEALKHDVWDLEPVRSTNYPWEERKAWDEVTVWISDAEGDDNDN